MTVAAPATSVHILSPAPQPGHYRYMLIDHLIYAAPDLDAAVADLEDRFGVRAQAGGRHTGLGTHNALLALGPRTYLEIIAPDPGQPAPPVPRPFGIDDLDRAALVSWALTCDDIDQAVTEAQRQGYDPGPVTVGQRVAPAGTTLRWRATASAVAEDLIPFLICWGDTEHPARSAPRGLSLQSLQIEHPDPLSLTPALMALGAGIDVIPVAPAAAPALVATLSGPVGTRILR
jgi:glyoxalase-like protein